MKLHELKRNKGDRRSRQVGRGGRRGKTSGRGTKGQKARAGHKIRPAIRDVIKKLPKLRGRGIHSNKPIRAYLAVRLEKISSMKVSKITPEVLFKERIVRKASGLMPKIKILDGGEISRPLVVKGMAVSAGAKKKIESAGGKII